MNKKGQAMIEFMTTYGWIIVLIFLIIFWGIIIYVGIHFLKKFW